MDMLSKAELTRRLGQEPEQFTFLGQCYDAGAGNVHICAVTQQETRIVFTIKPKSGKGRVYISAEAIAQFERWNADLWVKLNAGWQFLQLRSGEADRQLKEQAALRRLRDAEKRYNSSKFRIRAAVDKQKRISRSELPEYLQRMKSLLQRPAPFFREDSARALWFEQSSIVLEQALRSTPETKPTMTPEPVVGVFSAVPEIEF